MRMEITEGKFSVVIDKNAIPAMVKGDAQSILFETFQGVHGQGKQMVCTAYLDQTKKNFEIQYFENYHDADQQIVDRLLTKFQNEASHLVNEYRWAAEYVQRSDARRKKAIDQVEWPVYSGPVKIDSDGKITTDTGEDGKTLDVGVIKLGLIPGEASPILSVQFDEQYSINGKRTLNPVTLARLVNAVNRMSDHYHNGRWFPIDDHAERLRKEHNL